MKYSQAEIYDAAHCAYEASACSDKNYHDSKSALFVQRCVRTHNIENNDNIDVCLDDSVLVIPKNIVDNVCFAALDSQCTGIFWQRLAKLEICSEMHVEFEKDSHNFS